MKLFYVKEDELRDFIAAARFKAEAYANNLTIPALKDVDPPPELLENFAAHLREIADKAEMALARNNLAS